MKKLKHNCITCVIFIACFIFMFHVGFADDTCIIETDGGPYTFTAPVIPVTKTISSNRVYLAFFWPRTGNFWEGSVIKLSINEQYQIVDALYDPDNPDHSDPESPDNRLAFWPNGALKEDVVPFWATKDWADPAKSNYVFNLNRNIYTYLGSSTDLTAAANAFIPGNSGLTMEVLGNPTHTPAEIISYIRGADVFDEDADGDTQDNRDVITGDILHSEPLVVEYSYPDNSSKTLVYFGSNDGMLHAVLDTETAADGTEVDYGTEAWAFIPPDQLHRLKDIIEGDSHQYFVDSSPKAYFIDVNSNGVIDSGDGDRIILICGERKGGTSYFALDITDPSAPLFLWRINQYNDASDLSLPSAAGPDVVISELGESWSEPRFGLVKTTDEEEDDGIPVFFIGGGCSPDNMSGKAILAVNILTGGVVKKISNITGMNYCFPSSVTVVDADSNGFVDKVYVGDLGSQMWRFGKFTDKDDNPLAFPATDENIMNWTDQAAHILFLSDSAHGRKFFYPPSVTLEWGYDLIFMGTGDREDPCNPVSSDRLYAVKDSHYSGTLTESDLVDVTDPTAPVPDLNDETGDVDGNGLVDQGWYIRLLEGEKDLSEGVVFLKTFYVTTFLPGVGAKLYALNYQTGEAVMTFSELFNDGGSDIIRSVEIGRGLPSRPVVVITEEEQRLLVSVMSTDPGGGSEPVGPGILAIEPVAPPTNFFYLWWKEF